MDCVTIRRKSSREPQRSVFVTGCDSGIGQFIAKYLSSEGCVVFAGVLDEDSLGARQLANFRGKAKIHIIKLDVTQNNNVVRCSEEVEKILIEQNLELLAVVNNAAVMIFGEFEWQTDEHIVTQISVNLMGYMRVTKAFLHLLRRNNGRLVNISSHCASVPLPCLSVYSATKAAIETWSYSLSLEMQKFNVPVVTIHPGSFPQQSAILKKQGKYTEEMHSNMTKELREVSRGYFHRIMGYMCAVSKPEPIQDPGLQSVIHSAIFSRHPKLTYVNCPWRYSYYCGLISLVRPIRWARRWLTLSFMNLPNYR